MLRVKEALPDALKLDLLAAVKSTEPSNGAIKQYIASGGSVEGVVVKRLFHRRVV